MTFFSSPRAVRLANGWDQGALTHGSSISFQQPFQNGISVASKHAKPGHPALGHLILLVFEAVLEVVCVSLPGYIIARQGMFDAEMQKFVANLNVMLFTPCLIFTKLASQLTADKLADLAIIPVIFALQTVVSLLSSFLITKAFRFKRRQRNFVIAMGVFGNSNSLPISLVLSLSKTISGLHWDKIPGDNDDEVGARGILYLLIFQQLGQLLRWSWGYHVLLAPPEITTDSEEPQHERRIEQGDVGYLNQDSAARQHDRALGETSNVEQAEPSESDFDSGEHTPINERSYVSVNGSSSSLHKTKSNGQDGSHSPLLDALPTEDGRPSEETNDDAPLLVKRSGRAVAAFPAKASAAIKRTLQKAGKNTKALSLRTFRKMPTSLQFGLRTVGKYIWKFLAGLWEFMNPPLWAMLVAIIIASVPKLQRAFFTPGSFIENSITNAIKQSGGVAVPLILVVLGANLARNTLPKDSLRGREQDKEDRKLLIASIVSRMVFPIIIMTPLLALAAKYVPISILDDPIFVVVCFLLTGAPSALQLAQICQINGVFESAMSKLLFQSYVIWILPSTLVLVMAALEVLQWAAK